MHRRSVAKEHVNRIKAARAYAGLRNAKALAELIDTSESTVKRWEQGDENLTRHQRAAIADACRVPPWFLENGFSDDAPTTTERVEALESQMRTVLGRLAVLSRDDGEASAGGRQEPAGDP